VPRPAILGGVEHDVRNRDGATLLAQEIREEAGRLVHHPVAELVRLENVAEAGESAATPLLLISGVVVVIAAVLALFLATVTLAYYLAG
jgi:hypothetical protein